jgi:hypothetical protein
MRRRWPWWTLLVPVAVLCSCGAGRATTAEAPRRGAASGERAVFEPAAGALPTAQELEGQPPCVQDLGAERACFLRGMRRGSQFTCPTQGSAGATISPGEAIPFDLGRAWGSVVQPCSVVLADVDGEAARQRLAEAGMQISGGSGSVVSGAIPLSHLRCVARVEGIHHIECEPPADVIQ